MTAPTTRPVAVEELRRAWLAVQDGAFRHPARPQAVARATPPLAELRTPNPAERWTPASGELVVPVVGAAGSCGATTVALALATVAGGQARVVECASASTSGLAAASMNELGADDHGWVHGARDQVRLDRAAGVRTHPDVPTPSPIDTPAVTVIDVGCQVERLLHGHDWLTSLLANAGLVVVVARATIPGLRRLESTLHLLDAERTIAAVLGPPRRRWPRAVAHGVGGLTAVLVDDGRLVQIPEDRTLALHGLTPAPLPSGLLTAAGALLSLIEGTPHHAR